MTGVRQMPRRIVAAIGFLGAVLVVLAVGYRMDLFERSVPSPLTGNAPSLANHPIYSGYRFGSKGNVIDIGIQPLWLPGVISEVMRRDAILKSQLAERGMEVRFHSFLKGADVNFFLESGDLEAGFGGDMPALTACAKSEVSVASLIDQSFASIISRHPMMIPELKGKRIGYGFGSNAHYMLLEILAGEGLGPDDVRMIPIDVDSMSDALRDGRIDAFAAWEPTPTIAMNMYPEFVAISRGLTTGYLYFSRTFAERESETVKTVLASQLRAMSWITKSTGNLLRASQWTLAAGKKIGGETETMTPELFASIVYDGLLGISSSALLPAKDMARNGRLFREFNFLQEIGEISKTTKWEDVTSCFDRALVPEVLLQNERFQLRASDFIEDLPGPQ